MQLPVLLHCRRMSREFNFMDLAYLAAALKTPIQERVKYVAASKASGAWHAGSIYRLNYNFMKQTLNGTHTKPSKKASADPKSTANKQSKRNTESMSGFNEK